MIAVLAVSLAIAVIACVWLAARGTRQTRELEARQSTITALEAEATAAAESRAALEAETSQVRAEKAESEQRALDADSARTAAEQDLATAREAAAAAEAQAADAEARAEAAAERAERAEQAEEAAVRAAEEAAGATDPAWTGGPGPEVLWALELARTERTWRTSVAADPTSDVFEPPADPLRWAIEIDAAALREEVGVEFAVTWELDSTLEPVAALAVFRGAQELLAAAARVADEATVVVTADGDDVTIRLTDPEGSTARFAELGHPLVGPGLEGIDGGIRIVGAGPGGST